MLLLAMGASPALAQTTAVRAPSEIVTSSSPDSVAVTIYRDPSRGDAQIDSRYPNAFALISETRTVTLPSGAVTVRFEGVASGIVPQSAILFGTDPRERNRDAALLSQSGLVDAFTGQHVILKRTDPASGAVVEERARIRSAADRLVVETSRGIEAVHCSGLNQTLIYPGVPANLSAKPVLSMLTKDQPGGTVTITLAYIATGFDWDATYVATLGPDGESMAVLGWLTLVSGDETSFADATTSAVAGTINRSDDTRDDDARRAIQQARNLDREYGCWPAGTTSDVLAPPPPPLPAPPMAMAMPAAEIMVTAMRRQGAAADATIAVTAQAENLGDLKLYRIPVPVTVAAQSQKQVAFMVKDRVEGEIVYRARVYDTAPSDPEMLFRFRNRKQDGLGEPLPAGKAILYQDNEFGRMLVGETATSAKALDEEVELVFGEAGNVTVETTSEQRGKEGSYRHTATIRNANPFAVKFEIEFPTDTQYRFAYPGGRMKNKPGKRIWSVSIPANGTAKAQYGSSEN